MRLASLRLVVWWLAVAVCAAGCAPQGPHGGGEGPGGRRQPLALSPAEELAVGRKAYREVMQEYRGRTLPDEDPEVIRVRRVTARLVKAAHIEPLRKEMRLRPIEDALPDDGRRQSGSDRRDVRVQRLGYRFEWEANVVRDRQINAFCLPAGKLFVLTGILRVTGEDDDYLATVLSHEIAHALAHHASERVAREQSGAGVLSSLRYERFQESEADHIGVFLMPFAGYEPDKAVAFWERMQRATGAQGQPPEFLSDHPSTGTRIHDLRQWAPKAKAAKRAYDEGNVVRD